MSGSQSGAKPSSREALLSVRGLQIEFKSKKRSQRVVSDLSFDIQSGGALGVVGESGSGKSVTSLALMGLTPPGAETTGQILFKGRDLLREPEGQLQKIRGSEIAMIFQDPMTSLDPSYTIGYQLRESLILHGTGRGGEKFRRASRARLDEACARLLAQTGIPDPKERLRSYPHQLSGGMSQRAMIAMAIACEPKLLIADEPTTALDVTIQAQILDLLRRLRRERQMALILITHDLGVVAEMVDDIMVMRRGSAVEYGPAEEIVSRPKHKYTQALLECLPARHALKEFRTRLPTAEFGL